MMPKCVDCAIGICEEGDFRQLLSTTTPKHENETVLEDGDMATFFSGPMVGATSSREDVSPPTTGPRKGKND